MTSLILLWALVIGVGIIFGLLLYHVTHQSTRHRQELLVATNNSASTNKQELDRISSMIEELQREIIRREDS